MRARFEHFLLRIAALRREKVVPVVPAAPAPPRTRSRGDVIRQRVAQLADEDRGESLRVLQQHRFAVGAHPPKDGVDRGAGQAGLFGRAVKEVEDRVRSACTWVAAPWPGCRTLPACTPRLPFGQPHRGVRQPHRPVAARTLDGDRAQRPQPSSWATRAMSSPGLKKRVCSVGLPSSRTS